MAALLPVFIPEQGKEIHGNGFFIIRVSPTDNHLLLRVRRREGNINRKVEK